MTTQAPGFRVAVGMGLVLGLGLAAVPLHAEPRTNVFGDPFVQATAGLPGCPVPQGPGYTAAEASSPDLAHQRAQRGVSCWMAGRCRLPNAYLYDKEIIPRVQRAIASAGGFEDTSLWLTGQRRWVWIQGCVASAEQSRRLEQIVRLVDDVENVVVQTLEGTTGTPPYETAP